MTHPPTWKHFPFTCGRIFVYLNSINLLLRVLTNNLSSSLVHNTISRTTSSINRTTVLLICTMVFRFDEWQHLQCWIENLNGRRQCAVLQWDKKSAVGDKELILRGNVVAATAGICLNSAYRFISRLSFCHQAVAKNKSMMTKTLQRKLHREFGRREGFEIC